MSVKSIAAGILFMLAAGFQVQGQVLKKIFSEIEFIGGLGTTNYFGDVGGEDLDTKGIRVFFDKADIDLWQTRVALMTGLRVSNSKKFSFSMLLSPTFLSGSDERSKYATEGRHYSFKTSLFELSLQGEYYFADRMTGFAPLNQFCMRLKNAEHFLTIRNGLVVEYSSARLFNHFGNGRKVRFQFIQK